jgi:hypothetical protein
MVAGVQRRHLAALARQHGFDTFAERLAHVAAWGMRVQRSTAPVAFGASRLGGVPDLRPSTPWPIAPPSSEQAGQP